MRPHRRMANLLEGEEEEKDRARTRLQARNPASIYDMLPDPTAPATPEDQAGRWFVVCFVLILELHSCVFSILVVATG